MRILHVLDHSLPYFSGYSFRSSYIINTQRQLGLDPVVVTSPKHEDFREAVETMNEVAYHRVHWPSFYLLPKPEKFPLLRHGACVAGLAREVTRIARQVKPDVIHAHSPSLDGLAAGRAARRLGIPWIYELRYYEEDTAVDRGKTAYNSPRYRLARWLEQRAMEQADAVVTIASALRADLIERGIPADKIYESPNGVDTTAFTPRDPDPEIIARHNLAGKTVVGFIGSFYVYEGLDVLAEAILLLAGQHPDLVLLMAGEGELEPVLKARIPADKSHHFIFAGKVPHRDVQRYYSVMDILVYPRISSRLTELTTPLKPLEAMGMSRCVIGSRIGGISELVRDGDTGLLVEPSDPNALAAAISRLADHPEEREALAARGLEFVRETRDWKRIVQRYPPIYQKLIDNARRA
ncbi:MAG: TIGR04063 family PEP-CTERM/XrtA system glycosyltransferase [Blastocatellia bacterium]